MLRHSPQVKRLEQIHNTKYEQQYQAALANTQSSGTAPLPAWLQHQRDSSGSTGSSVLDADSNL